jgi:protein-disulfide isomerase
MATDQPPVTDDTLETDPDEDPTNVDLTPSAVTSPFQHQETAQLTPIRKQLRALDLAVWGIAAPAIGISWWLQNIALYKLISFCPWCMSSAFLVTFIFLLATKDLFLDNRKLAGEQKLLLGTVTFIAAMSFLMVLPGIMNQIETAKRLSKLEYNGRVTIKPEAPQIETSDMEVTGPANAPFTIVEFADYECPHCKMASAMLNEELKKHPNRFRFAFRNYPLPMHHWATPAALAAEAAGEQGKFWQMHDYIFAHQDDMKDKRFDQDSFAKYAAILGLDSEKFEKDEASDKILTRVATDATTAKSVKVELTPTFFVCNRKGGIYQITGKDALQSAIEDPSNKAWN